MERFWTSNKPIHGLRHFVLVNETRDKENVLVSLVSVVDAEINLQISLKKLINSANWEKGWLNLPKFDSITEEYIKYKIVHKKEEGRKKIFVNEDSLFNIS